MWSNLIKLELEKIRPKLIADGGNIEFINYILSFRFKIIQSQ